VDTILIKGLRELTGNSC